MSTRRAIGVYVDPENEHVTREIVEKAMYANATFPYDVVVEPEGKEDKASTDAHVASA